ncbi:hypothetical protein B9Z65_3780 [Elsinoe australis]|uniref:Uncharacterized protein n=1 Tax=Elsinoe australis TaxID=40998 RepID=A0A2P8AG82_9PEZI|nr:hypothetical protein B9Z65_3780 [Elsinoe australis]
MTRREEYHVGWICAVPSELAAAACMLDREHPQLPRRLNDNNIYKLGSIGPHNIAIACLPAGTIGTGPAAVAAQQMRASFPALKFGLMVGIGGGAPGQNHDIRLGDIVVSEPDRTSGGVIQYDHGRVLADGTLERLGSLDRPPPILLNALNHLKAEHSYQDSKVREYLDASMARFPRRRDACTCPGAHADRLFKAAYVHQDNPNNDCRTCSAEEIVPRMPRVSEEPVIHYGLIASGNLVMKDGVTRDQLQQTHHILCFEMEAAGLMNDFPCLVIRGICDYSDSHKNNRWQEYAAAVAAAYAKELLLVVPAEQMDSTPDVDSGTGHRPQSVTNGGGRFTFNNHGTVGTQIGEQTTHGPTYFGTVNNHPTQHHSRANHQRPRVKSQRPPSEQDPSEARVGWDPLNEGDGMTAKLAERDKRLVQQRMDEHAQFRERVKTDMRSKFF